MNWKKYAIPTFYLAVAVVGGLGFFFAGLSHFECYAYSNEAAAVKIDGTFWSLDYTEHAQLAEEFAIKNAVFKMTALQLYRDPQNIALEQAIVNEGGARPLSLTVTMDPWVVHAIEQAHLK